jgi:copper transport protein
LRIALLFSGRATGVWRRPSARGISRTPALPLALVAIGLALALAPRASAHATLTSTEPAAGAVVQRSPAQVVLRFDETVEAAFGSVHVLNASGDRVDSGRIGRPAGDTVALVIGRTLPRGTYTVAWRVVSADTHVVHGAFVFSVGAATGNGEGLAAQLLREEQTPKTISVAFTAVRFFALALILLVAGGVAALVLVLAAAADVVRSRLWAAMAAGSSLLVLTSLAGIILEGATAAGISVGAATHWDVISEVLSTRFGQVWLARAGVALALGVLGLVLAGRSAAPPRPRDELALVPAAALVLSPAAAGHASDNGAVAFIVDIAHVEAAAIWAGGLTFLLLALALERERRWDLAADAVPRFSKIAVASIVVLLAAGITSAYLEVRAWRGLWDTTYGRLLLVKAGLLLPVIALGVHNNRRSVPRLRNHDASLRERRRFLQATATELALVVAIVAVTAVLVSEPPARSQVQPLGPFSETTTIGDLGLSLSVRPARVGPNQIDLRLLTPTGHPAQVAELRVTASLPSKKVGPFRYTGKRAGPGHYIVSRATFPFAGSWQIQVAVRRGKFTELDQTITVPIP